MNAPAEVITRWDARPHRGAARLLATIRLPKSSVIGIIEAHAARDHQSTIDKLDRLCHGERKFPHCRANLQRSNGLAQSEMQPIGTGQATIEDRAGTPSYAAMGSAVRTDLPPNTD